MTTRLLENPKENKAQQDRYFVWCILFISIGNQYKLLFCGFLGKVLGFDSLCYTMVHGISTNHWFEHLIFVPLLWIALNHLNNVVFRSKKKLSSSTNQSSKKWLGQLLCVLFVYGHGIHFTNTLEIMARDQGVANGLLYEQIWWLDEQVSHWVQFCSFFAILLLFITQDGLDRLHNPLMAILTGILHGIDRGVGFVEGDNPILGLCLVFLIGIACLYRWKKHQYNFKRAWKDFFFRHALVFSVTILIFLVSYQMIFGLHIQPSTMGINAWRIVALAFVIILLEGVIIFGLDKYNRIEQFDKKEY